MSELVTAMRLELFKARRLRLLWALLALSVLFLALSAGVSYQAYRDVRRYAPIEVREAPGELRQTQAMRQEMLAVALRANLELPSAYAGVTGVLFFPGFVLITIAGATLVANEFTWGTVQRLLGRGRRRLVMVAAKLGLIGFLAAAGVVVGLAAGTVITAVTSRLLGALRPEIWAEAETWRNLGIMAVRLWAVLTVYGLAAAAAGFAWRSAGLAVGGALVYYFVEALVSGLIVQSRGWLAEVRPYLLGNVAHALVVNANPFMEPFMMAGGRAGASAVHTLDPSTAWLVLLAYAAAFSGLSVALFWRRDLPV